VGRADPQRENIGAGYVFVDGLGIGDVRDIVLRDRRLLAADGILVSSSPSTARREPAAGPS